MTELAWVHRFVYRVLTGAVVGEASFCLWLLVRGIDAETSRCRNRLRHPGGETGAVPA
jgi:hypothetical protein